MKSTKQNNNEMMTIVHTKLKHKNMSLFTFSYVFLLISGGKEKYFFTEIYAHS